MADIFNKDVVVGEGPLARSETMVVSTDSGTIGLAQNVSINYNQPLQRVYELGTSKTFMVSGRTQGNASIGRIIGENETLPTVLGEDFFKVDGGKGGTLVLKDQASGTTLTCIGCYVSGYSTSTDANGSIVTEQITIDFQSLETTGAASS